MEQKEILTWFEIPTSDLERAKKFYESLFGFQMTDFIGPDGLRMAFFPVDEGVTGGALIHHPEHYKPTQDGALLYLNGNPDLQVILSKIPQAGGKVLVEKTQISADHGFMAVFTDSESNRLALHSMK